MAGMNGSWAVTTQQETTRPDSTGRFVQGVLIGFQTSDGLTGTVFVPDTQYTPDYVKQVIQARVDVMSGIQGLNG